VKDKAQSNPGLHFDWVTVSVMRLESPLLHRCGCRLYKDSLSAYDAHILHRTVLAYAQVEHDRPLNSPAASVTGIVRFDAMEQVALCGVR
jgi:hypothetical protein